MTGRPRDAVRRSAPFVVTLAGSNHQHAPARGLAAWLARAAPRQASGCAVVVALVTDRTMRRLNRDFRGVDAPTDVLSFPELDPGAETPPEGRKLGEIAIAVGVAARQARAEGHAASIEVRLLALHGLLHLLGYDHERDHGQMRRTEERLRRRARLPTGLIARVPQRPPGR
jgi:probable rRNA maturation factor